MQMIREWSFPVAILAAWGLAASYTLSLAMAAPQPVRSHVIEPAARDAGPAVAASYRLSEKRAGIALAATQARGAAKTAHP